jgi:hypothetical protein
MSLSLLKINLGVVVTGVVVVVKDAVGRAVGSIIFLGFAKDGVFFGVVVIVAVVVVVNNDIGVVDVVVVAV